MVVCSCICQYVCFFLKVRSVSIGIGVEERREEDDPLKSLLILGCDIS